MSLSKSTEETPQRNGARSYPRALPQWMLNAARPVVVVFCRLMWRMEWRNTEYIPLTGGLIIAANHQTYIDPFWVCGRVPRPARFLAWDAAFNWPVVGFCLRLLGAWPLQLEGSDPAPIRRSLQWIGEGGAVMIFPEGGRGNPDGSMKKLKAGAVRMALDAGVPILPVTIRGGEQVWPNTFRFPRFRRRVEIIYHPLIHVEQGKDEGARACARRETERLAGIIRSSL
ncbi:MAG TPA: lysophospholipid acyltransferase family protein [Pyrinomonadaceae bacterium]